jgi:hypothetical protein
MTTSSIRNSIWDWLSVAVLSSIEEITKENADERIVWSMQNAKPQNAPFVSLHLVQYETDNAIETRETFDSNIETNPNQLIQQCNIYRGLGTVAVAVFGVDAILHCFNIKAALREWAVIEAMQAANLGLVGVSATQNTGAVIETAFEQRANFNLDFYFAFVKKVDNASIGHVPLQGTIEGRADIVDVVIDEP